MKKEMLIDFIPIEWLPDSVVWLDWMFYAHKKSFFCFLLFGIICWIIYCRIRYGAGIG